MKDYNVLLPCGEANMVILHDAFDKGYQQGYDFGKKALCDCKGNMEAEYNRGLNEAWEAAKKIIHSNGLSLQKLMQIFGTASTDKVLRENTASEAIAKIKEYEEQKQDAEQAQDIIKVWDEVYSEMNDLRFIVTRIITSKHMDNTVKRYEGICTDGACYDNLPEDIVKTGRTFPQIAEVLEKMRGESK